MGSKKLAAEPAKLLSGFEAIRANRGFMRYIVSRSDEATIKRAIDQNVDIEVTRNIWRRRRR